MTKRKKIERPFPGLEDPDPTDKFTYKVTVGATFQLPDTINLVLLDTEEIYIGDPAAEHIYINPTSLNIRNGETTLTQLAGSTLTLGDTDNEHINLTSTAVQIKDGATVYAELLAGSLSLGDTDNEHAIIDTGGIAFYDGVTRYGVFGATTVIGNVNDDHLYITSSSLQFRAASAGGIMAELTGTTFTLGPTASEHVNITPTAVQIKDGSTVYIDLTAGALTLGNASNEHVSITSTAVQIKDGATVYTDLTAGVLTLGNTAADHLNLSGALGLQIKDGATVRGQWQSDGDIFIGSNISSPGTTYFAIFAIAQTYNSESMGAGDMLIGDNSASKANILWDYSEGQLLFRGGTTAGAYIDTDGSLTAGAGNIVADADGITILNKDSLSADPAHAYAFRNSSGTITAGIYGADASGPSPQNEMRLYVKEESGHISYLLLRSECGASDSAQITLSVSDGTEQSITLNTGTPQIVISGDLLNINTTTALLPRITTTVRNGVSAINGMIIYNTTDNEVQAYISGTWTAL